MGIKFNHIALSFALLVSTCLNAAYAPAITSSPFEKEYNVVLMLPFCLGTKENVKIREVMVEYYEGVEMAIAELELMGMKMNLKVLDTKMDSLEVIRLLSDPEMQKVDLIIGPVYDNEMFEVEKFCSTYKIPLVSPLRYYPNALGADFPLINCNAVDSLQFLYTGQLVADAFKKFQVVVVDDDLKSNKSASRNFKKGYDLRSGKTCKIIDGKISTPELAWNGKDSLLLVYVGKGYSSSSSGITNNKIDQWIILGPSEWLDIDRFNYSGLNKMYFYGAYMVPYNDTFYSQFRTNYRSNYGGDPDRYTFIGYDQFLFFCSSLMAFDNDFYTAILDKEFRYTHRTFQFVKRGNLIENAGSNLFYLEDYNFYKAYWRY
ncbi:MAG: hypothetical protein IT245_00990 [Bacteroidia bacterium]|nr:hypothetical protein [Bacteroidia bacterium]